MLNVSIQNTVNFAELFMLLLKWFSLWSLCSNSVSAFMTKFCLHFTDLVFLHFWKNRKKRDQSIVLHQSMWGQMFVQQISKRRWKRLSHGNYSVGNWLIAIQKYLWELLPSALVCMCLHSYFHLNLQYYSIQRKIHTYIHT